ncbi:DUF4097 family beta strand repeat-containing protein [Bdellovibrionales bacterium]|nr:DUF4097 family beta strand repeat-containing protein [Bdellovibrionales bacterium]
MKLIIISTLLIGAYAHALTYNERAALESDKIQQIKSIEVDTTVFDIDILPSDDSSLLIEVIGAKTGDPELLSKIKMIEVDLSGSDLKIKTEQHRPRFMGFFKRNIVAKGLLKLSIPKSLLKTIEEISVNSSTGDIKILSRNDGDFKQVSAESNTGDIVLDLNSYSIRAESNVGDVKVVSLSGKLITKTDIETNTGDIELEGEFKSIEANSSTGSLKVRTTKNPQKINFDSSTGDLVIQSSDLSSLSFKLKSIGSVDCKSCKIEKNSYNKYNGQTPGTLIGNKINFNSSVGSFSFSN